MKEQTAEADFTHRVRSDEKGKMVRQVLKNRFRFSRRMFRRLKLGRGILLNGEPVYLTSRVRAGDLLRAVLPEEEHVKIDPQPVPLRIVEEDEDLIIIDKQPGIVVHPTKGYREGTLANGLAYHWKQKGEFRPVRPVTRLDKDTSGLIVFAKHAHAHAFLSAQMIRRRYKREYLAVVRGKFPSDEGRIDAPIARSPDHPARRAVVENGAKAVTHYRVIERFSAATVLRLRLETGRTHQIRVHLAHRGHPIIGDEMYGGDSSDFPMNRQALHASYLRLIHPREDAVREWKSRLPPDIEHLIHSLRS
ncbi:RluA family pseudouridine synthase [Paludifilum halophilum]|uniref:Pseudouridine synthase n=1 Tax=Paludifilum halophilum TaxID=1642702 RepID=A0A235B5E4_9BACL|nr:RluA family pseudouridine synthase [Paludifilum halophilum]OYD07514.1 hypothetical protein CHM34_11510 [Paludifilum halophilum]